MAQTGGKSDGGSIIGTNSGTVNNNFINNFGGKRKHSDEEDEYPNKTPKSAGMKDKRVQNPKQFANKDTIALLLAGVGDNAEQESDFEKSLHDVAQLFIKHFDIRSDNILTVECKRGAGDNRPRLLLKFKEIQEKKKSTSGNLLFYYLGHNNKKEKALKLGDLGIEDDYVEHHLLKKKLRDVCSSYMMLIIDTCYAGGSDLPDEDDGFPFLWDEVLGEEEEPHVLQWSASQADQEAWFGKEIDFTKALHDVLSDNRCGINRCKTLRKTLEDSLASIERLHPCVCDHIRSQNNVQTSSCQIPVLKYNKGNEKMHMFPLIATLE